MTKEMMAVAIAIALIVIIILVLSHFNVIDINAILKRMDPAQVETESTPSKPSTGPSTATAALLADIDQDKCIKIHFIDVGQGDSILVELGTDTILLIDAGHTGSYLGDDGKYHDKAYSNSGVPKAVTEPYFAYLNEVISNHGGDIDYLIATHRDSDHINMLPKVLDTYQVNTVFYNDCYNSSMSEKEYTDTVKNFETKVENEPNCVQYQFETPDDTIIVVPEEASDYKLTVYSSGNDGFKKNDANGMSILCLLEYGGRKVLFTGDATVNTEDWFIKKTNDPNFDIDVLKVGHHGSKTSSGAEFLDYIHAEYAVISSGKNNGYGHPTAEVMGRLEDRNMTIYNTQNDGTITLYIDYEGDFCFVTTNQETAQ